MRGIFSRYSLRSKLIFLLVFSLLLISTIGSVSAFNKPDDLSSWNNSQNKQDIINFVKDVTNKKSENFVPAKDRIAVFDADGTYYCEKSEFVPNSIGRYIANYRLKNDPNFKPSAELKNVIDNGNFKQAQTLEAMEGMTTDKIYDLTEQFKNEPHPCFNDLTFGEAFYKPMVELINYLQQNGFTVYVISGTDQDILRGMAEGNLNIPKNQICGSEVKITDAGFEDSSNFKYNMQPNDYVERANDYVINDKFEKVNTIHNVIGKQPIFAAGNSSGDISMLNYTESNPKYKSFTLMVNHDDDQREFAYPTGEKLEEIQNSIDKYGYHKISMKNDFKTIFKDGVTKKDSSEYIVYPED